ncbi:MAG: sensor histidine kinase [Bacillota bacterium]|nr:sensor histidine kinase [Bacillota bacterium]
MRSRLLQKGRNILGNMKINRKIQLSLMLIIVPLFVMFVLTFIGIYHYNQQYDRAIANTSEAGRFSIKFKEEFDYKIYLLIAGHLSFSQENPYNNIASARQIAQDLLKNTNIVDNKHRAESIIRLLGNLEKYVKRIEENKKNIGHYDENITIWENDVQLVTGLIQSTVLEYNYYETKGMEQVRSKALTSLGKITLFSMIVFAVLVLAALFLSFIIPNSIVKPIHHLNDITNQVAKGDLTARADILLGGEVAKLGNSLNIMIEKIENLLLKVKKDETSLREAELELLQSQINPHFLYNTLDTIIWLSESGKQEGVVEMVTALSDFFRTSLNHGNGMVTLNEEERHVRSYLQIQHVRYQDILEYMIDFPEEIKEVSIPKITLQPIVENALYHGIKNRRGKGSIIVSAVKDQDEVVISVTDNGIGMNPEQLNRVLARLERKDKNDESDNKRESYGLYNVNERIKLKFGTQYGLTISSVYGEGTCIQIKIPFRKI